MKKSPIPLASPADEEYDELDLERGGAFATISKDYPSLMAVLLEAIQNALDVDVNATRVTVNVDRVSGKVTVTDNGAGISREMFKSRLSSVCQRGRKGKKSIGEFGMGLIAPLSVCQYWTFTSCHAPEVEPYVRWKFVTKDILGAKGQELPKVPRAIEPNLAFGEAGSAKGKSRANWRSKLELFKVTKDIGITELNLDRLVFEVKQRFMKVMQRNKVEIEVSITEAPGDRKECVIRPFEWTGTPLPAFESKLPETGKVTFSLFLTNIRPAGRRPVANISIGSSVREYRVPIVDLVADMQRAKVDKETLEALLSGAFEGEIVAEKFERMPARTGFRDDSAWRTFCQVTLPLWYRKVGKDHYERVSDVEREAVWRDSALTALDNIAALLATEEGAAIRGSIKLKTQFGSEGQGHTPSPKRRIVGHFNGTAAGQSSGKRGDSSGGSGGRSGDSSGGEGDGGGARGENKDHIPLVVRNPEGNKRVRVKNKSLNLEVAHASVTGDPYLWRYNHEEGVITFNVLHEKWTRVEGVRRAEQALTALQERCIVLALASMVSGVSEEDVRRMCDPLEWVEVHRLAPKK